MTYARVAAIAGAWSGVGLTVFGAGEACIMVAPLALFATIHGSE